MNQKQMPLDEILHQMLAAVITAKIMEIIDKEGGYDPAYLKFRPLLVSGLLHAAYKFR